MLLFGVESGSVWFEALTSAVLVMVVPAVPLATVAVIWIVAVALTARLPTVHMPVPLTYEPWLELEETNVKPEGKRSLTATPDPASGPALVVCTVNTTFCPTLCVEVDTDFVSERSAEFVTMNATLAWSSSLETLLFGVESGSAWSTERTSAVFVTDMPSVDVTVALMVRVLDAPLRIDPTSHSLDPTL